MDHSITLCKQKMSTAGMSCPVTQRVVGEMNADCSSLYVYLFSLYTVTAFKIEIYILLFCRNKKKKIPLMTGEEVDMNLDAME